MSFDLNSLSFDLHPCSFYCLLIFIVLVGVGGSDEEVFRTDSNDTDEDEDSYDDDTGDYDDNSYDIKLMMMSMMIDDDEK